MSWLKVSAVRKKMDGVRKLFGGTAISSRDVCSETFDAAVKRNPLEKNSRGRKMGNRNQGGKRRRKPNKSGSKTTGFR